MAESNRVEPVPVMAATIVVFALSFALQHMGRIDNWIERFIFLCLR